MIRQRWEALDDLRGLAVFFMVPVDVAAEFVNIPAWFKHAPATGLTLADAILPVFLFSLGLSSAFSFKARLQREGIGRTLLHALVRYGVIFAFGTIGSLLVDRRNSWEVLQMLGATGLFSFFFLFLPPWPRLAAAGFLLAIVEVLRPFGLGNLMHRYYDSGLAGPWGTFSLSFLAVSASVLGEMIKEASTRRRLASSGALAGALLAGSAAAVLFSPFSKHVLSLSYILFTGGFSSALLAILVLWREALHFPVPLLGSLGRNALFFYMFHAILGVASHAFLAVASAAWIAWGTSLFVLALCLGVGRIFDWKKLSMKL